MTNPAPFDFDQMFAELNISTDSYSSDGYDAYDSPPYEPIAPLSDHITPLSDPYQQPSSPINYEYEVRFRCTKDTFVLSDECIQQKVTINIGDLVIVETDSGFDAGVVHVINSKRVNPMCKYMPTPVLRRILCRASMEHYKYLRENRDEEDRAVMLCGYLAKQKRVPISIVAAEMQYDRKKLTIIYTSGERVDFRELVKNMYQEFRMRIWMQRVTPSEAMYLISSTTNSSSANLPPGSGFTPSTLSSARVTALNTERAVYMVDPASTISPRRHSHQSLVSADSNGGKSVKHSLYSRSHSDGGSSRYGVDPYQPVPQTRSTTSQHFDQNSLCSDPVVPKIWAYNSLNPSSNITNMR